MKRILLPVLLAFGLFSLTGCGNLSPRINERIDNQGGKIDEIRNNQNGIALELGKLKQNAEIVDSDLQEFQQGMMNLNAAVSRNENSGIQILQGDGALMLIFSLGVIGMMLYYYRDRAIKSEQAADIMAQAVAKYPAVNQSILQAALNTESE